MLDNRVTSGPGKLTFFSSDSRKTREYLEVCEIWHFQSKDKFVMWAIVLTFSVLACAKYMSEAYVSGG